MVDHETDSDSDRAFVGVRFNSGVLRLSLKFDFLVFVSYNIDDSSLSRFSCLRRELSTRAGVLASPFSLYTSFKPVLMYLVPLFLFPGR